MESEVRVARRVKLRELRILIAVSQQGSLAKAAEKLAMSQPAVSKAIADLEDVLGVSLFDRTNRGAEPTAQGRIAIQRAVNMFDELRQVTEGIHFLADPLSGELRVGGPPGLTGGLLPHILDAINRERPGIRSTVMEGELEELGSLLRTRAIDVALSRMPPAGVGGDIAFERLFDERLFVVVGAGHPLSRRRKVTLKELAGERWIIAHTGTSVHARVLAAFDGLGIAMPEPILTAMSLQLRYELVLTDRFVTTLPGSLLYFGNAPAAAHVLPIDLPGGAATGFATLKGRSLSPVAKVFVDCARKASRPMADLDASALRSALLRRKDPIR
jgi:DNA-binding transcriptional LysR family regulator